VLAVDSDESEGLEQRRYHTYRSDIDERCARAQADFSFPTSGSQEIHVVRVQYAVLGPRNVNEDSIRDHNGVVARLGHYAYGLVVHRMSWSSGEWAGIPGLASSRLEDRLPRDIKRRSLERRRAARIRLRSCRLDPSSFRCLSVPVAHLRCLFFTQRRFRTLRQ